MHGNAQRAAWFRHQALPHTSYVSPGLTTVTSCSAALPGALLWVLCAVPESGRAVASISWQAASAWALSASGNVHRRLTHGGLQAVAASGHRMTLWQFCRSQHAALSSGLWMMPDSAYKHDT